MKIRKISAFLLAAALAVSSGCRSEEINQTTTSAPETSGQETSAAPAASETTVTETSAPETTETPEATTVSSAETTFPDTVEYTTSVTSAESVTTSAADVADTTAPTTEPVVTSDATLSGRETDPMIPTDDNVYLELSSGNITTSTDSVCLYIWYIGLDSDVCFYTGPDYVLEKYTDEGYEKQEFIDGMSWDDVAYEISEKSEAVINIYIDSDYYKKPLTAGSYRVRKAISGKIFSCCFDIAESDDIAERDGSLTLKIDEIKEDEFVCELVFPYYYVYHVICDTSLYPDLCAGDNIEVAYSYIYEIDADHEFRVIPTDISFSDYELDPDVCYKPVIYLYPTEKTEMTVSVDFNGHLTLTDPEYRGSWKVIAYPDGSIVCGGKEYDYLFWEGEKNFCMSTERGFCVSGEYTESFLAEKLAYLGLNEKETADFMDFWLPFMKDNKYNIITFVTDEYTDNARLDISPAPDTVIRVFMMFSPSDEYIDIPGQSLEAAPARDGCTVVEWGGSIY